MAVAQFTPMLSVLRRMAGASSHGPTDSQLLEQYLHGDNDWAFAALVERHGPMVHGVCRRVLGNCHDASQATFIVLLRQAHKIVHRESVGSWLHGVAYRSALKAKAAARRRKKLEQQAAPVIPFDGHAEVVWRELRPILDEEIDRLPERWRLPFVLCYLEGKTNAEAARQLRWPMGTVATRLAQARERLRKRLTQRGAGLAAATLLALEVPNAASAACRTLAKGQCSKRAVALAKGVSRVMTLSKRWIVSAVLLSMAAIVIGGGVFLRTLADEGRTESSAVAGRRESDHGKAGNIKLASKRGRREFVVECKLAEVDKDGYESVLSRPTLQMPEGQAAHVLVGQDCPVEGLATLETVTAGVEMDAIVTSSNDGRLILDVSMRFKGIPEVTSGPGWQIIQGIRGAHFTAAIKTGETNRVRVRKRSGYSDQVSCSLQAQRMHGFAATVK